MRLRQIELTTHSDAGGAFATHHIGGVAAVAFPCIVKGAVGGVPIVIDIRNRNPGWAVTNLIKTTPHAFSYTGRVFPVFDSVTCAAIVGITIRPRLKSGICTTVGDIPVAVGPLSSKSGTRTGVGGNCLAVGRITTKGGTRTTVGGIPDALGPLSTKGGTHTRIG